MSQEGDGIYDLSRGMTVDENLSMGVNQGTHYVLGGYGKFFLHKGFFNLLEEPIAVVRLSKEVGNI